MILLSDNDILFKLASCNLFEDMLLGFAIDSGEVKIAKRTRFSMLNKRQRSRIGSNVYTRLEAFLTKIADIDTDPHPGYYAALSEQVGNNIHAGEAVLFAVCTQIPDSAVMTGDKNCLIGLKDASTRDHVCFELCLELAKRTICFEQIIERIIDRVGFETVLPRLVAGRECDAGLRQWLGSTLDANEATFRAGLTSYLNDLKAKTGRLLMDS